MFLVACCANSIFSSETFGVPCLFTEYGRVAQTTDQISRIKWNQCACKLLPIFTLRRDVTCRYMIMLFFVLEKEESVIRSGCSGCYSSSSDFGFETK